MTNFRCDHPPLGWYCTRGPGHTGPCAAYPVLLMQDESRGLSQYLAGAPFARSRVDRAIGELVDTLNALKGAKT